MSKIFIFLHKLEINIHERQQHTLNHWCLVIGRLTSYNSEFLISSGPIKLFSSPFSCFFSSTDWEMNPNLKPKRQRWGQQKGVSSSSVTLLLLPWLYSLFPVTLPGLMCNVRTTYAAMTSGLKWITHSLEWLQKISYLQCSRVRIGSIRRRHRT